MYELGKSSMLPLSLAGGGRLGSLSIKEVVMIVLEAAMAPPSPYVRTSRGAITSDKWCMYKSGRA